MEAMIAEAKSEGRHERGPINLQATAVHIAKQTVIHREAGTGGALVSASVPIGMALLVSEAETTGHFSPTASLPPKGDILHRHTAYRAAGGHLRQHCCDAAVLTCAPAAHAGATTYRTVLDVDRGLSWAEAVAMRDAHVAEVRASGAQVDRHVGFHIFTTQKEVGRTGVAALHTLSLAAGQSKSSGLFSCNGTPMPLPRYYSACNLAKSVHSLASTLRAVTKLHGRAESEQLLLRTLCSAVP